LREDLDQNAGERVLAADIIEECDRLNGLITQLLQFARPATANVEAVTNLPDVLGAAMLSLQKDRKDIHWSVRHDGNPVDLAIDENSLRQILFNILLNAKEAITDGGTIEIAATEKRGGALITIADFGKGIPRKNLKNIFDPFFTTKEKGVGLGLSLTRNLVEQHGGTIEVRSREGKGTRVSLWLPKARKTARTKF
jgi:signal transduction histidine kinase